MTRARPLILIVDDNELNRKLSRDVLRSAGLDVLEAGTAADAITLALDRLPDVVLMDLRLPDLTGSDAARSIRSQSRTSQVPVVLMTALPVDADGRWLSDAGFAGSIGKPIDPDLLPDLVRGFVADRRG
jgi:CheY-like chemotaxis protein